MQWLSIGAAVVLANAATIRANPEGLCADHVRSDDQAVRQWVQHGCDRSVTFRTLAGRVGELHGIVYIQPVRHIRNGLQAALQFSVITTPTGRYFRVLLDVHASEDRAIAAIGHELQHAIEALQDPSAVSEATMRELFERLKITGMTTRPRGEYETEAAVKAGVRIASELKEHPTGHDLR